MEEEPFEAVEKTQKPPIFRSWRQFYLFVLVFHALIITLFYWFTKAYA
ncbi:MAG: hypothetical protein IPL49_12780 [Saprospirales bacterium]|nr:hypothetical protein [Saprospirales bacterium]